MLGRQAEPICWMKLRHGILEQRTRMSIRIAARQVLRWTACKATWKSNTEQQCISCRLLCSSNSQSALQSTQNNYGLSPLLREPDAEFSQRSLVDMGFTVIQADHIYDVVSKLRGGSAAKHVVSTLTVLFVLGLNPSSVLKLTDKCPQIYAVKEMQIRQRIGNLRKLGLVEGSLQRVVAHYPQILTVPVKTVKSTVAFLREKCLFTVQQVTDILRDCPAIVVENMDELEYKFQYVYFRMGVKQVEMVKSRLFRVTLDEVRHRHCFLDRRGMYHTPDKKGQTLIINPKLESILNVNEETFLTQVAKASAEEYEIFKGLMAREWLEEEQHQSSIEFDVDDEDDDDDANGSEEDDGNENAEGKGGYRKRRKK